MPSKIKRKQPKNPLHDLVLVVAVVEPLMTVPQIYQIWVNKEVTGVSLLTWSGYATASLIWLFYGYRIKDWPVIISSALWVLTESLVVIGALIY